MSISEFRVLRGLGLGFGVHGLECRCLRFCHGFRKSGIPFFGPFKGKFAFGGLYWGYLIYGNYHLFVKYSAVSVMITGTVICATDNTRLINGPRTAEQWT